MLLLLATDPENPQCDYAGAAAEGLAAAPSFAAAGAVSTALQLDDLGRLAAGAATAALRLLRCDSTTFS